MYNIGVQFEMCRFVWFGAFAGGYINSNTYFDCICKEPHMGQKASNASQMFFPSPQSIDSNYTKRYKKVLNFEYYNALDCNKLWIPFNFGYRVQASFQVAQRTRYVMRIFFPTPISLCNNHPLLLWHKNNKRIKLYFVNSSNKLKLIKLYPPKRLKLFIKQFKNT